MLEKFDSVVFFVENIHQASNWYADILEVEVRYENKFYAYIVFTGGKIGFHPMDNISSIGIVGQTAYWQVNSLEKSVEKFISKGAVLYRGPMRTSLNKYSCMLCDPFKNTIGLISKNA